MFSKSEDSWLIQFIDHTKAIDFIGVRDDAYNDRKREDPLTDNHFFACIKIGQGKNKYQLEIFP